VSGRWPGHPVFTRRGAWELFFNSGRWGELLAGCQRLGKFLLKLLKRKEKR
jgi:hypothetical protein